MRKIIGGVVLALVLVGCGSSHAESTPPTSTGQPFLPAYLAYLQGRPAPGEAGVCHPKSAADMLLGGCPQDGGK